MAKKSNNQEEVPKSSKALSGLNRELTDADLSSPGVQRMLLQKIDEYDACRLELEQVKKSFHEKDKQCAVLEEKSKSSLSFEVLYGFSLTIGAALIGLYPSIKAVFNWILLVLGIMLLVGPIVAKALKK